MKAILYISLYVCCISYVQNMDYGDKRQVIKHLKTQAKPSHTSNFAQYAIFYASSSTSDDLSKTPLNVDLSPRKKYDSGPNFFAAMPDQIQGGTRKIHSEEQILTGSNLKELQQNVNPDQYFLYTFNSPCCYVAQDRNTGEYTGVDLSLNSISRDRFDNLCLRSCSTLIKYFVDQNKINLNLGYTQLYIPRRDPPPPVTIDEFNYFISLIKLLATTKITIVREDDNEGNWFQLRFLRCVKNEIPDFNKLFIDPPQAEYLLRKVVNSLTWLCFKTQTKTDNEMAMFKSPSTCFKDNVKQLTGQGKSQKLENTVKICYDAVIADRDSWKLGPALNTNDASLENEPSSNLDDYLGHYSFGNVFDDTNM